MSAYGNINRGFAGMKAESYQFIEKIASGAVADSNGIDFGQPCFSYQGDDVNIYNYYLDTATLTFSTDLSASNSTVITINSVALDAVVFATTHAAAMAAIVVLVKAAGYDSTYSGDILYIRSKGATITATGVVSSGSAVTITPAYTSDQVFRGMARHYAKETQTKTAGVNDTTYEQYDAISIVEEGIYYGAINNVTVLSESICYIDNSGAGVGGFTSVTGDVINCNFRSNNFANSDLSQYLAAIQINGIKKINAAIAWS
jgi:hypothetical protein